MTWQCIFWHLTFFNANIVKIASTAPAAPKRCPVAPFVEDTLILSQCPSKMDLIALFSATSPRKWMLAPCWQVTNAMFNKFTLWCTGSMRVYIINISRCQLCVTQGPFHSQSGTLSIFRWCCHMVCIAWKSVSFDFSIDISTSSLGMLIFLQDNNTRSFANNETWSILVEWSRRLFRIFVICRRKRLCSNAFLWSVNRVCWPPVIVKVHTCKILRLQEGGCRPQNHPLS